MARCITSKMQVKKHCVMLLKTQKNHGEKDNYEELLKSNDYSVNLVNTLTFKFYNLSELRSKLEKSYEYNGLLLSSPRCVEAVYLAMNDSKLDLHEWETKRNYVVGETTHSLALEKLGLQCHGKESGNSKKLSEMIVRENLKNTDKPFLFPHGNLKTDTLKVELAKSNLKIECVLVYDTVPNPNLESEFKIATENCDIFPEFVVYFSPSGVRSSVKLFQKYATPEILKEIKFIAIGPVTEASFKEEGLTASGIASIPNPQEVLNVIKNLIPKDN